MYSANSLLRRYTPPTCTLEIAAKGSPLTRWFGRPLLEKLQFSLNFDDPRMPEHKRATVRGDKTQLDALCEVVQNYVQNFLDQSPDRLNASFLAPTFTDPDPELANGLTDPPATLELNQLNSAETQQTQLQPSHSPESNYPASESQNSLSSATNTEANPHSAPLEIHQETGIYLQQNGLLSHDLFLGSLATEESGPIIHLTLLQLFDLATALDEYSSDLLTLPNLNRPAAIKTLPPWAKIAAAVLVTVGIGTVAYQIIDRQTTDQPATTAINPETTPNEQPPIAAVPAPLETPGVPSPPVSSSQTLPPPPTTTTTPSPGATPPATPGVLPSLNGTSPPTSPLGPTPGATPPAGSPVPPTASSPTAQTNQPPAASPSPGSELYKLPANAASSQPRSTNNQRANVQILPSQTTTRPQPQQQVAAQPRVALTPPSPTLTPPPPAPSPPPLVAPPAPKPGDPLPGSGEQIALNPSPRQQPAPRPAPAPKLTNTPAPTATVDRAFSDVYQRQQGTENSPSVSGATASGTEKTPEIAAMPRQNATTAEQLPAASSSLTSRSNPNPLPTAETNANTLFDTIPQVAEARKYFQNRWQPPNSLTQRLEYSLALNADGSIRQIIPLGQVAETYLDRTEMPLIGESFVSPVDGKRTPKIRIVLNPNGKVDTFLESLD
ncbi:MAG TPA: DUF4335 domain-containing protein [Leptolyngbyaceae cyanobacterium]